MVGGLNETVMQETESRLSIHIIGRVMDCRNEVTVVFPHEPGTIILSVPIIPEDTVQDVRNTLAAMLTVHMERLNWRLAIGQRPYTVKDCHKAANGFQKHRSSDEIFDSAAYFFDEDMGLSPTCTVVQVGPYKGKDDL